MCIQVNLQVLNSNLAGFSLGKNLLSLLTNFELIIWPLHLPAPEIIEKPGSRYANTESWRGFCGKPK